MGDIAQLPAIGPSGFFHQLVRAGQELLDIPVVSLGFQYRNEDEIGSFVNAIRNGVFKADGLTRVKTGSIQDLEAIAFDLKEQGFVISQDILILSPLVSGRSGTRSLNQLLGPSFNPTNQQIGETSIYVGDTVITTKNDYADIKRYNYISKHRHPERNIDIYNGTRGTVVSYDSESKSIIVMYNILGIETPVKYTEAELPHWLEVGYAITIHKAQGSEADNVIVVNDKPNMTRNMLYTASSRAKQKLWLLGQYWDEAAGNPQMDPLSKFIFRAADILKKQIKVETTTTINDSEGEILFG